MVRNEALDTVLDHLLNRNLGEAIVAMDNFLAVHPIRSIPTGFLPLRPTIS